jgi:Methylamine utilisation protein MauE
MATAVSIWLGLALSAAAALKAWRLEDSARALATYGIAGAGRRRAAVWTIVCLELCVGCALLAGLPGAAWAAAALLACFAAATSAALLAGRGGRPCACFASTSRLSWVSPLRALALMACAVALGSGLLEPAPYGYARWLTAALALCVAAIALLAVALLALAREVGTLRLGADARGALEIPDEGPTLGERQTWSSAIPVPAEAVLVVAMFTSDGCPLCRQLAPAMRHVAADPLLGARVFDERLDAGVWTRAAVPGSPYAVALTVEGVALAKGTFNSLGQLESIVATARARERGLALAA